MPHSFNLVFDFLVLLSHDSQLVHCVHQVLNGQLEVLFLNFGLLVDLFQLGLTHELHALLPQQSQELHVDLSLDVLFSL